jgi:uncharacterized membrane protein YdbT with pleckstrin-like domain
MFQQGFLMNAKNIRTTSTPENNIVYQAHLHLILFFWPIVLLCVTLYLAIAFPQLQTPSYIFGLCTLLWFVVTGLTWLSSSLIIKKKQVILCTGILMRQTVDIPMSKIECIDIRQSIIGSLLDYGSLVITGTGGSRQVIDYLNRPLTCRRYIEQLMHG